ncbi:MULTISPECIES: hypothetical protein [unclassified Bradyrhizobium]|uniref:hypothetical protein n=1 Tax=unclassified Bradyrhizobium TaxID=2631580 RepID=UPI002915E9E2|nr:MULTISPECIES: hypothetical protein [unclassified Bradyrhizobium]
MDHPPRLARCERPILDYAVAPEPEDRAAVRAHCLEATRAYFVEAHVFGYEPGRLQLYLVLDPLLFARLAARRESSQQFLLMLGVQRFAILMACTASRRCKATIGSARRVNGGGAIAFLMGGHDSRDLRTVLGGAGVRPCLQPLDDVGDAVSNELFGYPNELRTVPARSADFQKLHGDAQPSGELLRVHQLFRMKVHVDEAMGAAID